MSLVLEAKLPRVNSTSSNRGEDLFDCLDASHIYTTLREFILPELNSFSTVANNWEWPSKIAQTTRFFETRYIRESDLFEESMGPLLPPKKKFQIQLTIKTIRRGKPSIAGDI